MRVLVDTIDTDGEVENNLTVKVFKKGIARRNAYPPEDILFLEAFYFC